MKGAKFEVLKDILIFIAAILVMAAVILPFRTPQTDAEYLPAIKTVTGNGIVVENGLSLIDINTADVDMLTALPGVGDVLAQRIIDHRAANGPFATVDGLLNVSGIGPATLERLRPEIGVSKP